MSFKNKLETREDLANFLNIPLKLLTYVLYKKGVDLYYSEFDIAKKSGDVRRICAPMGDLKIIQKRISEELYKYQQLLNRKNKKVTKISHGFEKEKSIITNASKHRKKKIIVNVDLEDFFNTIHFGRVKGYFEKNQDFLMSTQIATIIAQLTCYKGSLPQGSPCSPVISNLICNILDMRLINLAKKYKLDYTRYADDITFSTNNSEFLLMKDQFNEELIRTINNAGFKINNEKSRFLLKDSKQTVTGLVVNQKVNVDRAYYRLTRAMAHKLYANGEFEIEGEAGSIKQLEGRFAFINQIEKYNNLNKAKCGFHHLSSKEKEYQKFLFYKYFYANDKPLIITEGKTDIILIKSALKKMYKIYPTLVSKLSNGQFEFKISFLNKTERLRYFLNINQEGADTMKNIYNFYRFSKDNFPNYWTYFYDFHKAVPRQPVILIFDNELKNSSKPLYDFSKHVKMSTENKETLSTQLKMRIVGNLYLLTTPLVSSKLESEIEDLFDQKTLDVVLNGKKFSRNSNYDTTKFFGKDYFSKYVSENYESINFDLFKPLLSNLIEVIAEHNTMGSGT